MQAYQDPTTDDQGVIYETLDKVLIYLFSGELALKMIALGPVAYFRDTWNWIDFVVVVEGLLDIYSTSAVSLGFLRAMRALRPLRALRRFPRVRRVAAAPANAAGELGYALGVLGLLLLMVSLFAVTLLKGALSNRCFWGTGNSTTAHAVDPGGSLTGEVCAPPLGYSVGGVCGVLASMRGSYECSANATCVETGSSVLGRENFNNALYSMVTLFQMVSLDRWEEPVLLAQTARGEWIFYLFAIVIVSGAFVLANLIVVSLLGEMRKVQEEIAKERQQAQEKREAEEEAQAALEAEEDEETKAAREAEEAARKAKEKPSKYEEHRRKLEEIAAESKRRMRERILRENEGKDMEGLDIDAMVEAEVDMEGALLDMQQQDDLYRAQQEIFNQMFKGRSDNRFVRWIEDDRSLFNRIIQVAILLSGIALAADGYGISETFEYALTQTNLGLTALFFVELVFKLAVLKPRVWAEERANLFDAFIVAGSLVDVLFSEVPGVSADSASVLAVLKMMRLFRVLRFLRAANASPAIKHTAAMLEYTVVKLGPTTLLLMLYLFIFTVLAMQLFGDTEFENVQFQSFLYAFRETFVLFTGDGWTTSMHEVTDGLDDGFYAVYFILLVSVGKYVVMNLFLAAMLDGGEEASNVLRVRGNLKNFFRRKRIQLALHRWRRNTDRQGLAGDEAFDELRDQILDKLQAKMMEVTAAVKKMKQDKEDAEAFGLTGQDDEEGEMGMNARSMALLFGTENKGPSYIPTDTWEGLYHNRDVARAQELGIPLSELMVRNILEDVEGVWRPTYYGMLCQDVLREKWFQDIMLVAIVLSTLLIFVSDEPYMDNYYANKVELAIELGSLGFFTLELGLKIVGYTLYKGPYAVLKSGWNWLDLVLVVATAGDLALTPTFGGSATRFFNIFKAARPLRLGARIVPFRRLLTALGNSLRAMGAVLLIFFMGWFGVAVTGMLLFQGKMRTCIDDGTFPAGGYRYGEQLDNGTWTAPPCSGTWLNPDTGLNETREYEWDNPSILHFDSFGYAMLSSWVVINTEGWADLLWRTTAIVDEDYAPDPESEDGAWALVYFFLVILLFTLYLVNLVVGVLAETYARLMNAGGDDANSSVEGGALMAPDLKRFCEAQVEFRGSRPIQYPPPPGPLRRPFYRLSLSPRFEKAVTLLICAVAGVMLTNHEGQSDAVTNFQDSMEQFFCWAFVLEMIIMVIGQTPGVYFTAGRFLFDFFVTVMSVVDIGLFTYGGFCASSSDDNVVLSLFKGLRVLRLYRLCLRFEGTQRVLQMIFHAGQMIVLLVFLSVCLLFVMAQAGVAAFHGFDTSEYYEMRNQNFDDTRPALQLMFVVATGQKWLDYVDFLSAAGANPLWAAFFFFVALLAINFMLFNVIVVCLITSYEAEKNLCKYRAGLDSFRLAYAQFDVTGKEGIQGYRDRIRFLNMLEPPFTRPPYGTEEVRRGARELGVRRLLRRCCCCFRGPATRPKRTFITAHWQALLLEELEKFDGKYHEFLDSLFYLNDPDTDFGLKARFFAVQAAYYVAVIYRGFGRGMRRWKKHDQLPLLKQWKENRKHHKRHKKGHLPGLQVKPGLLLKQFSFSSLKGSFRTRRKKDAKVVGSGKDEHHGENTSIDSWDDGA